MKTPLLIPTFLFGATRVLAQGSGLPALGAGRVSAQVAAGTLATPIGFVAGGLAFRAVARHTALGEDNISRVADVGATLGIIAASAGAVSLVGARGPGHGSFAAALGGAALGTGVSGAIILVSRTGDDVPGRPCRVVCVLSAAAIAIAPSVGATLGYDLSRKR